MQACLLFLVLDGLNSPTASACSEMDFLLSHEVAYSHGFNNIGTYKDFTISGDGEAIKPVVAEDSFR